MSCDPARFARLLASCRCAALADSPCLLPRRLRSHVAVRGQAVSDAALRDRVLQLVDRLDAPTAEAQEAATASLIKLGPKILPLLPDPATAKTAERKDRVSSRSARRWSKEAGHQHGCEPDHDHGKGNPVERGTAAASETVGKRHHRHARAARSRGHQPRARSRHPGQAVLRSPGSDHAARRVSRRRSPPATARSASWPARRHGRSPGRPPPRAGQADGSVHRAVPRRAQANEPQARFRDRYDDGATSSSKPPGSRGSGRCS